MNLFKNDVAVSLVDDAFLFSTESRPGPVVIPAYVAIQTGTTRVLSCGEEAKAMFGKAPENITVTRVLVEGAIGDVEGAIALFRHGLKRLQGRQLVRPRVIIAISSGDAIRYAVKNVAIAGGAREIYLIEIGMATAIGMQLAVQKPEPQAVLSVSDDSFEFMVTSLAGVLAKAHGAVGTKSFVEDARNHFILARQFRPDAAALEAQLMSDGITGTAAAVTHGWEVWAGRGEQGRPVEQALAREEIGTGIMPSLMRMTERIKSAIRMLTSEQQYQVSKTTIHATGSAMAIPGLVQAISGQLGQTVTPFSAGAHPSIEGCRLALKELKFLRQVRTK